MGLHLTSNPLHSKPRKGDMKSRVWSFAAALTLFATLAIPVQLAAQDKQDHPHQYHHYQLIDLGTFGGPNTNFVSQGVGAQVLNNRGTVTGSADTSILDPNAPNCLNPDCFIAHAFQ
jgi:hypothetical protein